MRRGRCARCVHPVEATAATADGKHLGEFCGDCFEDIEHDAATRCHCSRSATKEDGPGPWQENAIRDLEDAAEGLEA